MLNDVKSNLYFIDTENSFILDQKATVMILLPIMTNIL